MKDALAGFQPKIAFLSPGVRQLSHHSAALQQVLLHAGRHTGVP
jgi:hypothetical protein